MNALVIALSVALLVQTRRLRHASQSADWNAALATRAKRELERQLATLGRIVERGEAEVLAWRDKQRP